MTNPIIAAIAMSGIILLINASMWDGNILSKIRIKWTKYHRSGCWRTPTVKETLEDHIPEWLALPLWECIICMTPWYCIGLGWPLFFGTYHPTVDHFLFLGITVWINVLVDTFVLGKREGL